MRDKNENIRLSSERAISYAKARGLSQEQSEDLAQRWVIEVFVKETGQRLEQAYIDFLRFEFGDTRTIGGARKSKDRRYNEGLTRDALGRAEAHRECDRHDRDERRFKLLNTKQYTIVKMLLSGLSQREIGEIFGVSKGRICQQINKIIAKTQTVDLDKEIQIDWITL